VRTKVLAWDDVRVLVLSAAATVCLYGVLAAYGVFPSVIGVKGKSAPSEHSVRFPGAVAAEPVRHHRLTAKGSNPRAAPVEHSAGSRGRTPTAGRTSGGRRRTPPPAGRTNPALPPQPASPTTAPTPADSAQPAAQPVPVSTTTTLPALPPVTSVTTPQLPPQLPVPPPPPAPISLPQVPQLPLPPLPQVPQLPGVQLPGQ
jgi:hypothetical protein